MSSARFEKVIKNLKKREISLEEFCAFLSLVQEQKYFELTQHLEKRKIPLKKYLAFLEKNKTKISPPSPHYLMRIERIGIRLLALSKIPINELNQLLQQIPNEQLSHQYLLKELLKKRVIQLQDFIEFEQADWTEVLKSPYQLRNIQGKPEFYLKVEKEASLGPYQLLEELGRGGMGVVYKAYHPGLNQTFAIKIIIAGEQLHETRLKRFHREVQALARLNHPGIVQIFSSGEEGNKHYFVMEYVNGTSLKEAMEKKTMRERLKILQQVLDALAHAHSQGIIHRDLKPQNIFVTQEGVPKIGDFGLAKDIQLDSKSMKLTRTGALLGTPHYMAPEQTLGEIEKQDHRTDIYALGVCLYQLLTQKLPFEANQLPLLLQKIQTEEPLPPSYHCPGLHRDLNTITLKALAKQPEARYSTAKEFAHDLERFLSGYPILARPVSFWKHGTKWIQRNRTSFLGGMIVGFVVIFLLSFLSWQKYQEQKQQRDTFYAKAQTLYQEAQNISSKESYAKKKKIQLFLNAFHLLNQALLWENKNTTVLQLKWDIGCALIPLACESYAFPLASYIAYEIQSIPSRAEVEKQQLWKNIYVAQQQLKIKQTTQLERWLQQLPFLEVQEKLRDVAIFEISRMTDEKVFQRLLLLLDEATSYFFQESALQDAKNKFYLILISALGRQENPKAGEPLFVALKKMDQKVFNLPLSKRRPQDLEFMVALVDALRHSKARGYALELQKMRFRSGFYSTFWDGTEFAFRQMVRAEQADQSPLQKEGDAYQNRAFAKISQKDVQGALSDYATALTLEPKNAEFYHNRAYIYGESGDLESAIRDLSQAIELNPQYALAYSSRGAMKYAKGDLLGCIEDCSKALEIDDQLAYAYGNRGFARYDLGDVHRAIADFDIAIEYNPQLPKAYYFRAMAKKNLKRYHDAIQDYTTSIQLNPKFAMAYAYRADTWFELQQIDQAIEDYSRALQLNPQLLLAYNARGYAKHQKGDLDGAIQDYNATIQRDEKFFLAYGNRGDAKRQKGDFQGAIEDYTLTIRLNPDLAIAYHNRGLARNALKDRLGAIQDFSLAIQKNSQYVLAYNNRALARVQENDFDGAIEDYTQALKITPNDFNLYVNRATALLKKGDILKAKSDVRKVFQLTRDLSDPRIQEVRRELLRLFPDLND